MKEGMRMELSDEAGAVLRLFWWGGAGRPREEDKT